MITCFSNYDTLAKTRSRMTTATTFSRQNDAASRASTTYYSENLILVGALVLESKALYLCVDGLPKVFWTHLSCQQ